MRIKEVEAITGISNKNIRYYENEGLIAPERNKNNLYREFSEDDISLLKEIKLYRNLGISIQKIKELLAGNITRYEILRKQIEDYNKQITHLTELKNLCDELKNHSDITYKLKNYILSFEDILYLDKYLVKKCLDEFNISDIVKAAMGASPKVNQLLGEIFPAINMDDEKEKIGSIKILEVEALQEKIVRKINYFNQGNLE